MRGAVPAAGGVCLIAGEQLAVEEDGEYDNQEQVIYEFLFQFSQHLKPPFYHITATARAGIYLSASGEPVLEVTRRTRINVGAVFGVGNSLIPSRLRLETKKGVGDSNPRPPVV